MNINLSRKEIIAVEQILSSDIANMPEDNEMRAVLEHVIKKLKKAQAGRAEAGEDTQR